MSDYNTILQLIEAQSKNQAAQHSMLVQSHIELRSDFKELSESVSNSNSKIAEAITELSTSNKVHTERFSSMEKRLGGVEKVVEDLRKQLILVKENIAPNTFTRRVITKIAVIVFPTLLGGAAIGLGIAIKMGLGADAAP